MSNSNRIQRISPDDSRIISSLSIIDSFSKAIEEILMNSIDSKASNIILKISFSSLSFEVQDDGIGIPYDSLKVLSLKYYSSSKDYKDNYYGYKGRSIVSISLLSSTMTIESKIKDHSSYQKVFSFSYNKDNHSNYFNKERNGEEEIEDDNQVKICEEERINSKSGTIISVQNLFSLFPIRKKSLVKAKEINLIKEFIKNMSIIHHNISWTVYDQDEEKFILSLSKEKSVTDALLKIYGSDKILKKIKLINYSMNRNSHPSHSFSVNTSTYKLEGLISYPLSSCCHYNKDFQFFYLNKKWIKKKNILTNLINKFYTKYLSMNKCYGPAVKHSVQDTEKTNIFPFFILKLTCSGQDCEILSTSLDKEDSFPYRDSSFSSAHSSLFLNSNNYSVSSNSSSNQFNLNSSTFSSSSSFLLFRDERIISKLVFHFLDRFSERFPSFKESLMLTWNNLNQGKDGEFINDVIDENRTEREEEEKKKLMEEEITNNRIKERKIIEEEKKKKKEELTKFFKEKYSADSLNIDPQDKDLNFSEVFSTSSSPRQFNSFSLPLKRNISKSEQKRTVKEHEDKNFDENKDEDEKEKRSKIDKSVFVSRSFPIELNSSFNTKFQNFPESKSMNVLQVENIQEESNNCFIDPYQPNLEVSEEESNEKFGEVYETEDNFYFCNEGECLSETNSQLFSQEFNEANKEKNSLLNFSEFFNELRKRSTQTIKMCNNNGYKKQKESDPDIFMGENEKNLINEMESSEFSTKEKLEKNEVSEAEEIVALIENDPSILIHSPPCNSPLTDSVPSISHSLPSSIIANKNKNFVSYTLSNSQESGENSSTVSYFHHKYKNNMRTSSYLTSSLSFNSLETFYDSLPSNSFNFTPPPSLNSSLGSKFQTVREFKLKKEHLVDLVFVGQVELKFLLAYNKKHKLLLIFDQHAVDERIHFEEYEKEVKKENIIAFLYETPLTLQISYREVELLVTYKEVLFTWKFNFTIIRGIRENEERLDIENNQKRISSNSNIFTLNLIEAPLVIDEPLNIKDLLEFCEYLKNHSSSSLFLLKPPAIHRILASKSCRNSIKFNQKISKNLCLNLLEKLANKNFPFQCAHGRPSVFPPIELRKGRGIMSWMKLNYSEKIDKKHPNRMVERLPNFGKLIEYASSATNFSDQSNSNI